MTMKRKWFYPEIFDCDIGFIKNLEVEEKKMYLKDQLKFLFERFLHAKEKTTFKDIVHLKETVFLKNRILFHSSNEQMIKDKFSEFKLFVEKEIIKQKQDYLDFRKYYLLNEMKGSISATCLEGVLEETFLSFEGYLIDQDVKETFTLSIKDYLLHKNLNEIETVSPSAEQKNEIESIQGNLTFFM